MVQGLIENLKEIKLNEEDSKSQEDEPIAIPFVSFPTIYNPKASLVQLMSNLTDSESEDESIDLEKCAMPSALEYLKKI